MDSKTKEITKKESNLSWLLLFLLQCTVDIIDCFCKLSLAIPYIDLSDFFIQADRVGISSARQGWHIISPTGLHIIAALCAAYIITPLGVYFVGLMIYNFYEVGDMQFLAELMIYKASH